MLVNVTSNRIFWPKHTVMNDKIFTLDNYFKLVELDLAFLKAKGSKSFDVLFKDINNSELESNGARYFWSEYTKNGFIDEYYVDDDVTIQYCGVVVKDIVSLLVIEITEVTLSPSHLEVLFQIDFDSKSFLDCDNYLTVLDKLKTYIVLPFYVLDQLSLEELDAKCVQLYHAIQYECLRIKLNTISPNLVKLLKTFDPKTLVKFSLSE